MKIKTADFVISAPNLRACPNSTLPEVAMIGRSNVGKSSLINMLTEKRNLAKVSATPGKTQLINFFNINGDWHLVDLPGYGYAKVGQEKRADFSQAVATYIEQRETLALTLILIDSRLEPQDIDIDFIKWMLDHDLPFALVFTKIDKQSSNATRSNIEAFKKRITFWCPDLPPTFATSAEKKTGRGELLRHIDEVVNG